ncbi:MAG: hypothetical protein M1814_002927 [Vezdaea aestivalis]|nr:MAG: hypothetical protein M1814_002927 [Vezdaea aestivalis]
MAGFISSIPHAGLNLHLPRIPYFLIFYSTTFTFLILLLTGLLLIPLADSIQQCVENKAYFNIFILGGVYLLTGIISLFIYGSRLYTFRTQLATIPKSYIPVDKRDLPSSVYAIVHENLTRSATIAHDTKPRDLSADPNASGVPPWGQIRHPGFSEPAAQPTPGQLPPHTRFEAVIAELPHLIEARAVSILPSPPPAEALDLFQRPSTMGLREYLVRLGEVGLMSGPVVSKFLKLYEEARFLGHPISQPDFEQLMESFAEVLRGLAERGKAVVEALDLDEGSETSREDSLPGEEGSLESMDEEGSVDSERVGNLNLASPDTRSLRSFESDGTVRITQKRRKRRERTGPQSSSLAPMETRPTLPLRKGSEISMTGEGSTIRLRKKDDPEDQGGLPYAFVEDTGIALRISLSLDT